MTPHVTMDLPWDVQMPGSFHDVLPFEVKEYRRKKLRPNADLADVPRKFQCSGAFVKRKSTRETTTKVFLGEG